MPTIFDEITEQEWKAPPKTIFDDINPKEWGGDGSVWSDIPKALVRGIDIAGESMAGTAEMIGRSTMDDIPQPQISREGHPRPGMSPATVKVLRGEAAKEMESRKEIPSAIADTAESVKNIYSERAQREEIAKPKYLQEGSVIDHPERLIDPRYYANLIGENAPNMAIMMAPGMAAYRGAKAAGAGINTARSLATKAGMVGAFSVEAGSAYNDAKDDMLASGMSKEDADKIATGEGLTVGIVNAMLEVAPLNVLLKNPAGKKLIKRAIFQGLSEGTTEAVQENVNMAVAQLGHQPDANLKDWLGRTVESALAGIILGAGTGAVINEGGNQEQSQDIESESPERGKITRESLHNDLVEKRISPEDVASLKEFRPELSDAVEGALSDFENGRPNSPEIKTVKALPKEALPQYIPGPKSAQGLAGDPIELARKRNQSMIDSINIDAENEIANNERARQEIFNQAEDRKKEGSRIVHTMPDGSIMEGLEHEGAIPGSEQILPNQETPPSQELGTQVEPAPPQAQPTKNIVENVSRETLQGQQAEPNAPSTIAGKVYSGEGDTVTLYHGLPVKSRRMQTGYVQGPVYFTPNEDTALEYGSSGGEQTAIKVEVPRKELMIDFDLPSGRLLNVEDANSYSGNDNWDIDDYIDNGYSVGIEQDFIFDKSKYEKNIFHDNSLLDANNHPSSIAEQYNKENETQVSYDGEQNRDAINKPPLHSFTFQSGPLKGRSFNLETPSVEGIQSKENELSQQTARVNERPEANPPKATERAWTGRQWRPITDKYELKRGKNSGKFRVTFPDGRKKIVDAKSIRTMTPIDSVKETLSNNTGSSQIATDIINHGIKLKQKGIESLQKFRSAMREKFKDVWDKIKGHMRSLYNALKSSFPDLKSARGSIEIEGKNKKPEMSESLKKYLEGRGVKYGSDKTNDIEESGGKYRKLEALENHIDEIIYWIADKNRPFEAIQKKLDNVTDDINVFLKETQRPKRTAARIQQAWDVDIKPFIESVAKSGYNLQDVEEYAHAKHAPEANKALAEANSKRYYNALVNLLKGKQKTEAKEISKDSLYPAEWNKLLNESFEKYESVDGIKELKKKWDNFSTQASGMADAEANEILKKYRNTKSIEKLRTMLADINKAKLDTLYDSGLITEKEYESIKGKYQFYVPLYREGYSDALYGPSRGLKPSGRPIKVRGGSTRNVVNIVANSIANYEKAINLAEKARSTRALRELVKENQDPDFWSLEKVHKSPSYDSAGNLREYPDLFNVGDNEFRFMSDGKQYLLNVNRDNPNAMRMIKTLKGEPSTQGWVLNSLAKINRILARVNTSWSPEFIVSNFIRDLQTAGINIKDTGVQGKSMLRGALSAAKSIYAVERGKQKGTDLEKLYDRFKMAGGKIGWADVHGSIENLSKKITVEIEKQQGKRPTRKIIGEWLDLIENTNTAIENGVRLHAFKLATKQGFSDERAAQIASDLTVDFTKKGAAGPAINSLYLFANAGIQGSYRIMRAASKSRAVQKTMAGVFGVGFLTSLANSMAGNDDDGEDYFNKIPDYIRERNAIFMIPGTKGKYAKIPLPWGYNLFWNFGTEFGRVFTKKNYKVTNGVARLASTFFNAFNPIQSGTLLQTLAPTIADPFVQVSENKNWFGGPLMPEKNIFSKVPKPDSQRYWKSARVSSVWVSSQLNKITGGDKVKTGVIDISPETIDLILDTVGGSALRFFTDTSNVSQKLIKNEEIQFHEIPFWRRIAGEKTEFTDSQQYFNNVEQVLTAQERIKVYKGTDSYKYILKQTENERKLFKITRDFESRLRKLRKIKKKYEASGLDKKSDLIDKQINKIYTTYNKKYNEIIKQ